MKILNFRIITTLVLPITLLLASCKLDPEIEPKEEITTDYVDATIYYYMGLSNNFPTTKSHFVGYAGFNNKSNRNTCNVGNVEIGNVFFSPLTSSNSIYYSLVRNNYSNDFISRNFFNWGKEVEIKFGANEEQGFKSGRTKIYLPKPLFFNAQTNYDNDIGYFVKQGGTFYLKWEPDTKIDSVEVTIEYDGLYNNSKDTSLSLKDIQLNYKIPNNGKHVFPAENFSQFKVNSDISLIFSYRSAKRIKLNNKVYQIDCFSNSGCGISIVN